MKLYNHELEKFIDFLYRLKLVDYKSRMRTKFIRILTSKLQEFKQDHAQLLREHSNLDVDGNPKIIEKDGVEVFDVIDLDAFNKAFLELQMEEVVIEQNEERRNILLSVKDSVLNCGLEFEGEESVLYDRWCDIVEQINE